MWQSALIEPLPTTGTGWLDHRFWLAKENTLGAEGKAKPHRAEFRANADREGGGRSGRVLGDSLHRGSEGHHRVAEGVPHEGGQQLRSPVVHRGRSRRRSEARRGAHWCEAHRGVLLWVLALPSVTSRQPPAVSPGTLQDLDRRPTRGDGGGRAAGSAGQDGLQSGGWGTYRGQERGSRHGSRAVGGFEAQVIERPGGCELGGSAGDGQPGTRFGEPSEDALKAEGGTLVSGGGGVAGRRGHVRRRDAGDGEGKDVLQPLAYRQARPEANRSRRVRRHIDSGRCPGAGFHHHLRGGEGPLVPEIRVSEVVFWDMRWRGCAAPLCGHGHRDGQRDL